MTGPRDVHTLDQAFASMRVLAKAAAIIYHEITTELHSRGVDDKAAREVAIKCAVGYLCRPTP